VCEVQGEGNVVHSDVCVRYRVRGMLSTVMCVRYRVREMLCTVMCVRGTG
jgi:hypothetical protein